MKTSRTGESGFTLLELMVAMVLIAVGLLSFAAALITAGTMRRSTAEQTVAMNAARYAVEEIAALDTTYISTNLNGWCFYVAGLAAPDPTKPFPDETMPVYYPSSTLPDNPDYAGGGGGAGSLDPYMDSANDERGLGLPPATDGSPTSAYGTITVTAVDPTSPYLFNVAVTIEWGGRFGNRHYTLHFMSIENVGRPGGIPPP